MAQLRGLNVLARCAAQRTMKSASFFPWIGAFMLSACSSESPQPDPELNKIRSDPAGLCAKIEHLISDFDSNEDRGTLLAYINEGGIVVPGSGGKRGPAIVAAIESHKNKTLFDIPSTLGDSNLFACFDRFGILQRKMEQHNRGILDTSPPSS